MRYVIFVIEEGTSDVPGTGDGTASGNEMAAIDTFNDALRAGGHWVMAAGIGASDTATLVDNRHGRDGREIDGRSLFDGPAYFSGFWIVEAPSDEVALTLARDGSRACNRRVEVRPFLR